MPCSAGTAAMLGECSSCWRLRSPLAPREGTRQPVQPVGPLMLGMGQDREHGNVALQVNGLGIPTVSVWGGYWSGHPGCISFGEGGISPGIPDRKSVV